MEFRVGGLVLELCQEGWLLSLSGGDEWSETGETANPASCMVVEERWVLQKQHAPAMLGFAIYPASPATTISGTITLIPRADLPPEHPSQPRHTNVLRRRRLPRPLRPLGTPTPCLPPVLARLQ